MADTLYPEAYLYPRYPSFRQNLVEIGRYAILHMLEAAEAVRLRIGQISNAGMERFMPAFGLRRQSQRQELRAATSAGAATGLAINTAIQPGEDWWNNTNIQPIREADAVARRRRNAWDEEPSPR